MPYEGLQVTLEEVLSQILIHAWHGRVLRWSWQILHLLTERGAHDVAANRDLGITGI